MFSSFSTYARVLALQGLCLLLVMIAAAGAIRWYVDASSLLLAKQAYAQLAATDALLDHQPADALSALKAGQIAVVQQPPLATNANQPFLQQLRVDVGAMAGDERRVVLSGGPGAHLWLQGAHHPSRWVGLPVTGFRDRAARVITAIVASASLTALLIAALIARLLVRPLVQLAAQAESLVDGSHNALKLDGAPPEVRALASAIASAAKRTTQAQRERETLLAGISHDLRTPLTRLRLALEMDDHRHPDSRESMVADLVEMESVIENCLAFVRDGREEQPSTLDLAALVRELVAQQTAAWSIDAAGDCLLRARPIGLRRAIRNLLINAEQHGNAPFGLRLFVQDGQLRLQVLDSGPGVTPDQLARLTEPFYRADTARTSTGTGLGLSIARRALELDGATLTFSNRSAGGLQVDVGFPHHALS